MSTVVCGPVHDADLTSLVPLPPVLAGGIYEATQPTYTDGDTGRLHISQRGELLVKPGVGGFAVTATVSPATPSGTPTSTTPTMLTAMSVTIAAANASRKYLLIQNNSAANIMANLSAGVLTGIVPTLTNIGIVIVPGGSYESPAGYITLAAITAYQTSGGTINTVAVVEG